MLPEILFLIIAAPAIAAYALTVACARAHRRRSDW